MLEFLIDNIMDEFGGHTFQLIMGILIETNCDPLLADLFVHSYQAEDMQKIITDKTLQRLQQLISLSGCSVN